MRRVLLTLLTVGCFWSGATYAAENDASAVAEPETEAQISDADMAIGYYLPLAESGSAYSQLTMGEIYMEGRGVERDLVAAYAWFFVAVKQGVDEASGVLQEIYKRLSDEEKQEADELAQEFVKAYTW